MKKAFSLIELSIVILIIGILIAGVTQSSRLIAQMRLATARAQTQSSPVTSISGLSVWYESTSEKSFLEAETDNNLSVSSWFDINPQTTRKINVTQSSGTAKPTYIASGINNLPVISFDGGDNLDSAALTFDNFVSSNQATFFVVQKYTAGNTASFGWQVTSTTFRFLIHAYHQASNAVYFDFGTCCGSDARLTTTVTISANQNIAQVISATKKTTGYAELRVNGAIVMSEPSAMNSSLTTTSTATFSIGAANGTNNFEGQIAEVIIFNRALKNEERQAVEQYLGKKWGIKIS